MIKKLENEEILINEFLKQNPAAKRYRLYDSELRKDFQEKRLVEDNVIYVIHFTTKIGELFRFIITGPAEKLGDSIAEISLKDDKGVFIKNPQIFRENDTDNTYRVRAFYVKKVMTLNNYNLIMDIYMNAKKYVPKLRTTIFSFLYEKAINYYTKKNFTETVKALKNIREIENDRFYY